MSNPNREIKYGMSASNARSVDVDYLVSQCVGEGWRDLMTRLVNDLFDLDWDGVLLQCKEKFGGLRFYIQSGSDDIYNRIREAEIEANRTCEVSGEPGQIRCDLGWCRCLSDAEYAKAAKAHKERF